MFIVLANRYCIEFFLHWFYKYFVRIRPYGTLLRMKQGYQPPYTFARFSLTGLEPGIGPVSGHVFSHFGYPDSFELSEGFPIVSDHRPRPSELPFTLEIAEYFVLVPLLRHAKQT